MDKIEARTGWVVNTAQNQDVRDANYIAMLETHKPIIGLSVIQLIKLRIDYATEARHISDNIWEIY